MAASKKRRFEYISNDGPLEMPKGSFDFQEKLGKSYQRITTDSYYKKATGFRKNLSGALRTMESPVLGGVNKINKLFLKNKGIGFEGGFKTVGSMIAKMPLKHLSKAYGMNVGFFAGTNLLFTDKGVVDSVLDSLWESVPFTLGVELAGASFPLLKYTGYQITGSMYGLGSWGSLGLQVVSSTIAPNLATALFVGGIMKKAGEVGYELAKKTYKLGKAAKGMEWGTGDTSWATNAAATMRQRSVSAIQQSHLNMRSMLGNEAQMLMGR